jgi:hypothetical protein
VVEKADWSSAASTMSASEIRSVARYVREARCFSRITRAEFRRSWKTVWIWIEIKWKKAQEGMITHGLVVGVNVTLDELKDKGVVTGNISIDKRNPLVN